MTKLPAVAPRDVTCSLRPAHRTPPLSFLAVNTRAP